MLRVLVMGHPSHLAGAIVSNLAQGVPLEMRWLSQHEPGKVSRAAHENCPVMVVVEEAEFRNICMTADNLLWDHGCLRMIMISSPQRQLQSGTIE